MKTDNKPSTIVVESSSKKKLVDYAINGLLLILGVGGTFYFGKKFLTNSQERSEEAKVGAEGQEQATAASEIEQGINPSGFSWLKLIDGTNAKQIMDATIQALNAGKKLSDIENSYRKLTQHASLDNDLKQGLTSEQYHAFTSVVRILSKRPDVRNGDVVISKGQVTARKTPYINGTPRLIDRRGNSIDYINSNTIVGIATGEQHISVSRDSLLADKQSIATLFIKVQAISNKSHKLLPFWVAASLVTFKRDVKSTKDLKLSYYIIDEENYNKAGYINKPFLD